MIRTIPLNKLVPSPRNVRRAADEQADLQLKADIEARGLLQNLVVTSVAKPKGCFAVEAGERRRRSLVALAEEDKLAKNHEVCCLILESDDAAVQEASLAENFQRLSMNPADECTAFSALIEQGADIEGIARRFGLTVRFVEGRLRLAALAPVIFDALGAGEISLDVAKAYAATPDRERQEYVFEQMSRGYGAAHPDSVRRMMTQATVGASDRRALFVGEQAYVAAGGRVERDLFSEDSGARWLDIAILERLACEKMEAAAAQVASETGLGFVRPTLDSWVGHTQTQGLRRVPVEAQALSDEETAEIDRLDGEIEELVARLEQEQLDGEERSATEAQIRALGANLEAILNKPPVIDEVAKSGLGAILILDEEGRPRLDGTLYAELPADDVGAENGDRVESEMGDRDVTPAKASGLSQRLVDELAMQRRDILAVHVAADPGFALDLAIFLMIDREAGYSGERSGSSLIAAAPSNPVLDFKAPDAAATIARTEASDALDRGWTGGDTRARRFDAFAGRYAPDEPSVHEQYRQAHPGWFDEHHASENDLSIAFELSLGDFEFWSAGDLSGADGDGTGQISGRNRDYYNIELPLVRYWQRQGRESDVEIFRANHHGSDHSNTPQLFDALDPEHVFYSAHLGYGHPRLPIVDRGRRTARQWATGLDPQAWGTGSRFRTRRGRVPGEIRVFVAPDGASYTINGTAFRSFSDAEERADVDAAPGN